MNRYTVYTDSGDYTGVWADSAAEAERKVICWTLGRRTVIGAEREERQ